MVQADMICPKATKNMQSRIKKGGEKRVY